MKLSKKINASIALLLITLSFNTYTMEPENAKKVGWVALAGAVIVGGVVAFNKFLSYIHTEPEPIKPFNFGGLPTDIQKTIIALLAQNTSAKTLQEAAQTIRVLAQTNNFLNQLINDPAFCLDIIKHLAEKFDCSDEEAAAALQTHEAKQRLLLQKELQQAFRAYSYRNLTRQMGYLQFGVHVPKKYIDLEFTYLDKNGKIETLLMIYSSTAQGTNAGGYDKYLAIISLMTEGIDVNRANAKGITALMLAAKNQISSAVSALTKRPSGWNTTEQNETIKTLPTVNVNQQDLEGNTALLYSIITTTRQQNVSPSTITELLLNAGADPELANNAGLTPLQAAQDSGNQEIIDLIQDAIDKKHGIK